LKDSDAAVIISGDDDGAVRKAFLLSGDDAGLCKLLIATQREKDSTSHNAIVS
jgi:hypothetical protein